MVPFGSGLALIVLLLLFQNKFIATAYSKWLWLCLVLFLAVFVVYVGINLYVDINSWSVLNRYDLNHDGMFNGLEITGQQQDAMANFTNDTGRTFASLVALIYSLVFSVPIYLVGIIIIKIRQRAVRRKVQ